MKTILVTGWEGLIGSEVVKCFGSNGGQKCGGCFAEPGDTTWNLNRLHGGTSRFGHRDLDVRKTRENLRPIQGAAVRRESPRCSATFE